MTSQNTHYFPYPKDTNVDPIEVPLLPDFQYDFTVPDAFANFPRHHGFHDPSCSGGINVDRPERELAAFLQAWLFFGLISELVGHAVDPSIIVQKTVVDNSDAAVIDPRIDSRLEGLLLKRFEDLINCDPKNAEAIKEDIRRNINIAQEYLTAFERVAASPTSTLAHVTLSVRLLLSFASFTAKHGSHNASLAMSYSYEDTYGYPFMDDTFSDPEAESFKATKLDVISPLVISRTDLSAQLLACRMRDNGWCPQRIKSALGAALGYPVLYYISSTKCRTSGSTNHKQCSADGCVASNMLGNSLKPSHTVMNCTCIDIEPPMLEVAQIIQSGGIPLVRVRRMPRGQIEIDVIPCTPASRYVAISHVWSDGQLGSTENALPQCQLERLDELIADLPRSSGRGLKFFYSLHNKLHNLLWRCKLARYPSNFERLFWLDTMCIPMGQGNENARKKAINMMGLIYSSADRVLVLDAGLQQVSGGSEEIMALGEGLFSSNNSVRAVRVPEYAQLLEILAHVYSCNWMGRAWTYQECFLGRDTVIRLKDSFIFFSLMNFRKYEESRQLQSKFTLCKGSRITVPFLFPFRAVRSILAGDSNKSIVSRIAEALLTGCWVLFFTVLMPIVILFGIPNEQRIIDRLTCRSPYSIYAPLKTQRDFMFDILHRAIRSQDITIESNSGFFVRPFGFWEYQKLHFIRIWNCLLSRSTTKAEDLPVIVANMAGFNASYVAKSNDPGERMRSILFSLNLLPMELLFINGRKYAGGSDHPDRWIPRAPCDEPLATKTQMQYTDEGFNLDSGYSRNITVFMLKPFTRRSRRFRLTTYPENMVFTSPKDQKSYWVEALAPHEDKLPEFPEAETCLILDCNDQEFTMCTDENRVIRGARMIVVKKLDNKVYLQYDCAIRVSKYNSLTEPYQNHLIPGVSVPNTGFGLASGHKETILHAKRAPMESTFILQHSCRNSRPLCLRRPVNPTSFDQVWMFWFSGIGAIILFIGLCILAGQICWRVSGTRAEMPLQVLAAILLCYALPLLVFTLRYVLRVLAYQAWRSTFEESWTPTKGKFWWWWWIASFLGFQWS